MRYIVAVLLVVVLAVAPAVAGLNPDCKLFVTFDSDPADYAAIEASKRLDPGVFEEFTVYYGILDYSSFITITLKMSFDPGVATSAVYTSLLPGGLTLGDWEVGGATLTSTTPVASAVEGPLYIFATANAYAFGTVAGEIKILDHDDYPRWVVGSDDVIDNYCMWQNAAILMDPVAVEEECFGDTAVELQTWGGIKALYR